MDPVRRYMETLDKLLTDYAYAGIQALGLVPDFLLESAKQPQPFYNITFMAPGNERHSYFGTFAQHQTILLLMAARKK